MKMVRCYEPLDIIQLDYPDMLYASVVHPQIEVKTADSKKILKKERSVQSERGTLDRPVFLTCLGGKARFAWLFEL